MSKINDEFQVIVTFSWTKHIFTDHCYELQVVVRDDTIQKLNNEIGKLKAKHHEKLGEVQKQGETIRKLQEALTKSHIELDASRKTTDEEVGDVTTLLLHT